MLGRRTAFPLLLVLGIAAAGGGLARADAAGDLLDQAAPEVRDALDLPARAALSALLGQNRIDREQLGRALGKVGFAPYAAATLTALARVDGIPGAKETFDRLLQANDDAGVRGSSFELQAAAALGDRVAAIGPTIRGDEIDLLLRDGTIVEVKNDAPDEARTLSSSLSRKAIAQLRKRGRFGDPVMLVVNEPLPPGQLARFRRDLGPASEVVVLSGGRTYTQLARAAENNRAHRAATRMVRTGPPRSRSAGRPPGKAQRARAKRARAVRMRGRAAR